MDGVTDLGKITAMADYRATCVLLTMLGLFSLLQQFDNTLTSGDTFVIFVKGQWLRFRRISPPTGLECLLQRFQSLSRIRVYTEHIWKRKGRTFPFQGTVLCNRGLSSRSAVRINIDWDPYNPVYHNCDWRLTVKCIIILFITFCLTEDFFPQKYIGTSLH